MPILPEAWDTLMLFLALATQWRRAGMEAAPVGLDYAAVEPTAKWTGIAMTEERFADLRAMEAVALAEAGRRRK